MDDSVRRPRIGDVARRAGVSTATVSRTLANPSQVSPAMRAAVLKAVKETGYVVDVAARNLRTRRTHAVLAVVPNLANVFFSRILRAISDTLRTHGYSLIIADTGNDPVRERDHAEFVRAGRVDGLLLLNGRLLPLEGERASLPTVSLCERIPGSTLFHVETSNREAAQAMTSWLLEQGHRRVAYVSGPADNVLEHDRFAGFRDALDAAGLVLDPALVCPGDFTLDAGEAAARRLLQTGATPDAVFACSDAMAMGVVRGFTAAGLSVPADVSVAGFDDIEFAGAYNPALTTVRQARSEIGARAASMLVDLIEGRVPEERVVRLPAEIVVRDSTRRARSVAGGTVAGG
jgi:LacI family transcriptional regulator, repressor for deo operon, udp, cdd, tsx, nupC, and nupG